MERRFDRAAEEMETDLPQNKKSLYGSAYGL